MTCISFNPRELTLCSAGYDKKAKYWDLENFTLDSETKMESTAIEAVCFDNEGKFIFSASTDSLKIWHADKKCKNMGSVPVKWRNVKDLKISKDNKNIYCLSVTPNSFAFWQVDWLVKTPVSPVTGFEADEPSLDNYSRAAKQPPKKALSKDSIADPDIRSPHIAETSNPKFNLMESFSEIRKEHKKFSTLLEQKHEYLKPIFFWLNKGDSRSALNAIEKQNDPFIVVDLLNMIMNTKKIDNINIEFTIMLLKKAKILTESGYIIHIKTGLLFVSQAVAKYKNVPKLLKLGDYQP